MMSIKAITFGAVLLVSIIWAASGQAQQPPPVMLARSYVSTTGSDSAGCNRNTPCRTFRGAAAKTQPRGEITALETGDYGGIRITKTLTLQAVPGALAMMSLDTPIVINTAAEDVVTLRRLHLTRGPSSGTRGIRVDAVGALHIENCVINGFPTAGISGGTIYEGGHISKLFVKDSIISDNGVGIQLDTFIASINRCRIESNTTGIAVGPQAGGTISDCHIAGNGYGLDVSAFTLETVVEDCVVTNNGTGIRSQASVGLPTPTVFVSDTMISGNDNGLVGSSIRSFGNNRLAGNNTNGSFTLTLMEQ